MEVMIAIAFIGVALVAVIRSQGQGIRLAEKARATSRDIFLARQILSETQLASSLSDGTDDGTFEEPLDDHVWEREITAVPGMSALYKVQVWVNNKDNPVRSGVTLQGFANGAGQ